MFGYYYNKSLRKLVVGFGTLFSNLYVSHKNASGPNTDLRVPVTYASQEKFIQRLLNPSSITDGTRIENQLPRISYVMNNIVPDPSRRRVRTSPAIYLSQNQGVCQNTGQKISNEIPVNVGFNLFVYTRHIDDMLQIVEQIMPFFVPDHVITMDLTDSAQNVNIPIVMVSNNLNDRYDGDLNNRRMHIVSFNFLAKSYIYGESKSVTTIITTDENTIEFDSD
jgi:hypothetical protein